MAAAVITTNLKGIKQKNKSKAPITTKTGGEQERLLRGLRIQNTSREYLLTS